MGWCERWCSGVPQMEAARLLLTLEHTEDDSEGERPRGCRGGSEGGARESLPLLPAVDLTVFTEQSLLVSSLSEF